MVERRDPLLALKLGASLRSARGASRRCPRAAGGLASLGGGSHRSRMDYTLSTLFPVAKLTQYEFAVAWQRADAVRAVA